MTVVRRILGVLALTIGASVLTWMAYNYLIEMQPQARGRNPIPPLVFSAFMLFVGVMWIRGKKAG